MRTISEQIARTLKRIGRRMSRPFCAMAAHVRKVVKRVQGGSSGARQPAVVSNCATPVPAHVITEKAAQQLGLPRRLDDMVPQKYARADANAAYVASSKFLIAGAQPALNRF